MWDRIEQMLFSIPALRSVFHGVAAVAMMTIETTTMTPTYSTVLAPRSPQVRQRRRRSSNPDRDAERSGREEGTMP
jgi:hypothetical protein